MTGNQTTAFKRLFRTKAQGAFYIGWACGILIGSAMTYLIFVRGA